MRFVVSIPRVEIGCIIPSTCAQLIGFATSVGRYCAGGMNANATMRRGHALPVHREIRRIPLTSSSHVAMMRRLALTQHRYPSHGLVHVTASERPLHAALSVRSARPDCVCLSPRRRSRGLHEGDVRSHHPGERSGMADIHYDPFLNGMTRQQYLRIQTESFRRARLLPRPYKEPGWRPRAAPRVFTNDPFVFLKNGYQDE
jgi:hypothetical protein